MAQERKSEVLTENERQSETETESERVKVHHMAHMEHIDCHRQRHREKEIQRYF
jgi:hypothetical protein